MENSAPCKVKVCQCEQCKATKNMRKNRKLKKLVKRLINKRRRKAKEGKAFNFYWDSFNFV